MYFFANKFISSVDYSISYYVDEKTGFPTTISGYNQTYDPRGRPWYLQAKALRKPSWSSLYLDSSTGDPVITFVIPISNYSLNGRYYRFAGAVAVDLFLTDITHFLQSAYANTDRRVYIVDSDSGYLLGSSWDAVTATFGPDGSVSVPYNTISTANIIS